MRKNPAMTAGGRRETLIAMSYHLSVSYLDLANN
jgi:hypothetical protein